MPYFADLSPNGKLLAVGISGGSIQLRDMSGPSNQLAPPRGKALKCGDFLRQLRISSNGKWLVACGQDGTARVWHLQTSPAITPHKDDCGRAHLPICKGGASTSPDGQLRLVPTDGGAKLVRTGANPRSLPHKGQVIASQFASNGKRLATFAEGSVRIWDATNGLPMSPSLSVGGKPVHVPRLEFSDDGRRVAAEFPDHENRQKAMVVWEETGRRLFTLPSKIESNLDVHNDEKSKGRVTRARLSPDGHLVAAIVGSSGELSVFKVDTGKRVFRQLVLSGVPRGLEFSPTGKVVLTASSDHLVRQFDTATGKPAGPALRQPREAAQIAVGPKGQRVLTVAYGGGVLVWDRQTGDLLARVQVQAERGRKCWFSRDGKTIQYFSKGQFWRLHLPTYQGPQDAVPLAVRLITGRYLDENGGVADVWPDEFKRNRHKYRKAWLSWQGLTDDRDAQP